MFYLPVCTTAAAGIHQGNKPKIWLGSKKTRVCVWTEFYMQNIKKLVCAYFYDFTFGFNIIWLSALGVQA
jgi:hypothetical protein